MFLRKLNQEQKGLFLKLAMEAANANNIVEESEKRLLNAYAEEMDIDTSEASALAFEDVLRRLKMISTKIELNQIMFELVGLLISDLVLDEKEKNFMDKVCVEFEIEPKKIGNMFECVKSYTELIKKINYLLFDNCN